MHFIIKFKNMFQTSNLNVWKFIFKGSHIVIIKKNQDLNIYPQYFSDFIIIWWNSTTTHV